MAFSLATLPSSKSLLAESPVPARAEGTLEAEAAAIAAVFPDEEFCLLVPPRPIDGLFVPEGDKAAALARDHQLARRIEGPLRAATPYPFITLAPSYPFDAARHRVIDPILVRILGRNLWLYADYWEAARGVVLDGEPEALPRHGLQPLRHACAPAVMLFVFSAEDGGLAAAGYVSLLTGRLLAAFPEAD